MADERTPEIVIEDAPGESTRAPRSTEGREAEGRPNDSWVPSGALPTPEPKDGWTFRWIRTGSLGTADNSNVSRRFREGWIPVKSEEVPELMVMSDLDSRFEEGVEIGGLLLCKMPTEKVEQRNAHYQKKADSQMTSVDNNYMRENDPRMPLLDPERSTRTTFGKD